MTAKDFIDKWRYSINHLNLPSIGIHVDWDNIPNNANVQTFYAEEAWEKLYSCTPPWFKVPQTFKQLTKTKNDDYMQIVREETDNGKISYYRKNGLQEPFFCAFANSSGSFILLGDGNHRLLDSLHLIHNEGQNFNKDIKRSVIDIIYLENFADVLLPENIWGEITLE